ncbi:IclR family transcriptional regulator [Aureimonas fodinaquatilis]|uniref:IclR family transcriptional regulator n=1 Tax=Aureimonas fodinaquatilis TaxID=2565783 RepID=UPI00165DB689|nr:helix-turn-helix domain-containing protein [Aureimonas fodinaquatilis]
MSQPKGVEAVDRAILILRSFDMHSGKLTLAQIAERTGFYKSTILRLVASLEREGFIVRTQDKSYSLGPELLRLGSLYQRSLKLEEYIRPALKRLLQATGESASFFIRSGEGRSCLFREDSSHTVRDHVVEGETLVLKQGAAGHVLVDYALQLGQDSATVAKGTLPRFSFGERVPDVAASAVPVFGLQHSSTVLIGALTLSGPKSRFTPELCEMMGPHLLREAKALSDILGARITWVD